MKMTGSIRAQIKSFLEGFYDHKVSGILDMDWMGRRACLYEMQRKLSPLDQWILNNTASGMRDVKLCKMELLSADPSATPALFS